MTTAHQAPVLRYVRQLVAGRDLQERSDQELLEEFTARRSESAFAALVGRHGPMVLRVCRRVLGHEQDAEDAFQATFLVLAQSSRSIRKRAAVADWLHGAAYRIAMKAKRTAARRRHREDQPRPVSCPAPSPTWSDVQAVLDEELRELAAPYRQAFVLCVLEGKTNLEAAAVLGCKQGTIFSRLARARQQLQRRLAQRGIVLSALLTVLALAEGPAQALAGGLARRTIKYGLLATASAQAAAQIPAHIHALAKGASAVMLHAKLKVAAVVALTASLLAAAAGVVAKPTTTGPTPPNRTSEGPRAATAVQAHRSDQQTNQIDVRGKVLDPEGKTVAGAKLVLHYLVGEQHPKKVWATTGPDGTFAFSLSKPSIKEIEEAGFRGEVWNYTYVMAAAEGHGFAWARLRPESAGDMTLRLVPDNVPIHGRVLDLQGKPVARVRVRVVGVEVPSGGDFEVWVKARRANQPDAGNHLIALHAIADLFPVVTTGADGSFEIHGLGRDRIASLYLEGPSIATQRVKAMSRKGERVGDTHGATFTFAAMPTRPIVGVVRDKDTGKPLAGAVVRSYRLGGAIDLNGLVRATTDKDGRYRLVGLAKGEGHQIIAQTRGFQPQENDLPYFPAARPVENIPGLEPITIDFALKRGVWVKGRVIDRATGKSVAAGLEYFCFANNPQGSELLVPDGIPSQWTRRDGTFQTVALPGRTLIAVRAQRDQYRMAVGADRIEKDLLEGGQLWNTLPYHFYPGNCHTVAEVVVKGNEETIARDIYLEAGGTLMATAVGPEGKLLADLEVSGARPMSYWEHVATDNGRFSLYGLAKGKPRLLQAVHRQKKLAGYQVVKGDEKSPIRVNLKPWGTVTGQLLTPGGEAVTKASIHLACRADQDSTGSGALEGAHPDKDGKFRISGLAPGLRYGVSVSRDVYILEISGPNIHDVLIGAGETKDLGVIQVKPME